MVMHHVAESTSHHSLFILFMYFSSVFNVFFKFRTLVDIYLFSCMQQSKPLKVQWFVQMLLYHAAFNISNRLG